MADFCHDFDPGGLGCGFARDKDEKCPDNCIGDFQYAWENHKDLKSDYEVLLGICEGHGTLAYLWNDEGTIKFIEYPIKEPT